MWLLPHIIQQFLQVQQVLSVHLSFRFTQDELLAIDLEGRCVITDHGQFILFNLYGPAITNEESAEERFAYKLRLYKVQELSNSLILPGHSNLHKLNWPQKHF